MAKLTWDKVGERYYENGVKKGVLFPQAEDGTYPKGVAWSGLTGVTETGSGAEATPLYADDIKYLNLMSKEEFGATITAYTAPPEFGVCDGTAEIATGVAIGQQPRNAFGMSYQTILGNDVKNSKYGYKLHFIYGALASPSERAYATESETPEAMELSWEVSTTPVDVEGFEPTATVVIDSTKVKPEKLAALEAIIYGSDTEEPRLPLPSELITLIATEG